MAFFGKNSECGQATIEAAILIPVLFIVLLMLVQPAILLYDRVVMKAAASDACRLLATKTSASGSMDASVEAFVRHRLGAVPPVSCFHVHDGNCSWDIKTSGGETSANVSVAIETKVKPLPLFDVGASLLDAVDGDGYLSVKVEVQRTVQPDWVQSSPHKLNPKAWVEAWQE